MYHINHLMYHRRIANLQAHVPIPEDAWEYQIRKSLNDAAYNGLQYVPYCSTMPVPEKCDEPKFMWVRICGTDCLERDILFILSSQVQDLNFVSIVELTCLTACSEEEISWGSLNAAEH